MIVSESYFDYSYRNALGKVRDSVAKMTVRTNESQDVIVDIEGYSGHLRQYITGIPIWEWSEFNEQCQQEEFQEDVADQFYFNSSVRGYKNA